MVCSLYGAEVKGECRACHKKLTGRRTRWCSDECSDLFWRDHDWQTARKTVLLRDGYKCVKCGAIGRPPEAEIEKLGTDMVALEKLWFKYRLEVNHIAPLAGSKYRGYRNSCAHHIGGLECVCRACHVVITNAQRKAAKEA